MTVRGRPDLVSLRVGDRRRTMAVWLYCAAAHPLRNNRAMKPITRWILRTAALWATAKLLEYANTRVKQFAQERRQREAAERATALPRAHSRTSELTTSATH